MTPIDVNLFLYDDKVRTYQIKIMSALMIPKPLGNIIYITQSKIWHPKMLTYFYDDKVHTYQIKIKIVIPIAVLQTTMIYR